MIKLILIDPSYISHMDIQKREFSLGLITIGGYLKKALPYYYDIDYFMPENVNGLDFQEWVDYMVDIVVSIHPDIIGCTSRCDTYPFTISFLKRLRTQLTDAIFILGGPQATNTDLDTMKLAPEIDYIIRGEGEITFVELLMCIRNKENIQKVSGITFRTASGEIVRTKDRELMQNLITYPDYRSIIEINKDIYINRIEVGRGCPYHCIFCSLCKVWGAKYRLMDVEAIVQKMASIHSLTGSTNFVLEHDNLLASKSQAEIFLQKLIDMNIPYTWSCSARIDNIRRIDISLLQKAGCKDIYFGIETGSQKMQKKYRKNIDVSLIIPTLKKLNSQKIRFTLSFICGHPLETLEDIEDTLLLGVKCNTLNYCSNIQIHKLAPLAGSRFIKDIIKKIVIDDKNISDQSNFYHYELYKKMIRENPLTFSSFYSVPLHYVNKNLLRNICKQWINIINFFPRTLYCIYDNTNIHMIDLLQKCETPSGVLSYVNTQADMEMYGIVKDIFYFEQQVYECKDEFDRQIKDFWSRGEMIYNPFQRVVETYEGIMDFNMDTYKNKIRKSKLIRVRLWFDKHSHAVKYVVYTNEQHLYILMCQNNDFLKNIDKKLYKTLVNQGFLLQGGTT